jgi:SAM-dependent methyltransferase
MFQNEDEYWWFVSRRSLVLDQARQLELSAGARILDIGCGTGATAAALLRFGRVLGVDMSPLALACCARRGLTELMLGQAESLPLAAESVDLIVATDILEHLDDDVAALAEFRRVLKPGGHAIVTVPAYERLWSEHDDALMHRRRYVAPVLRRRIAIAGLEPVRLTYALSFLLPLALGRLLKRRPSPGKVAEAQIPRIPPVLNAGLIRVQRLETALLRAINLPWGLSVLAVIRKPLRSTAKTKEPIGHEPTELNRMRDRSHGALRRGSLAADHKHRDDAHH